MQAETSVSGDRSRQLIVWKQREEALSALLRNVQSPLPATLTEPRLRTFPSLYSNSPPHDGRPSPPIATLSSRVVRGGRGGSGGRGRKKWGKYREGEGGRGREKWGKDREG